MNRLMSLLLLGLIATNAGCTLCSNCDDYSYGAFGGVWERSDLTYGRVGSAFSPHGHAEMEMDGTESGTAEAGSDAMSEEIGPGLAEPGGAGGLEPGDPAPADPGAAFDPGAEFDPGGEIDPGSEVDPGAEVDPRGDPVPENEAPRPDQEDSILET